MDITLRNLPKCKCGGELLPVQDVSREGVVFLKGWFCPGCSKSWLFASGIIVERDVCLESLPKREKIG